MADVTKAVTEATAAKAAAGKALADAKAATDKSLQAHQAAEKAAQAAEAAAKTISGDAGKSAEEKKKADDAAKTALTQARQNQQQTQTQVEVVLACQNLLDIRLCPDWARSGFCRTSQPAKGHDHEVPHPCVGTVRLPGTRGGGEYRRLPDFLGFRRCARRRHGHRDLHHRSGWS